jgi:hypothetical protein
MPCLNNGPFVIDNEMTDLVELSGGEPMIPRKFDWHQPELGVVPISSNMNVNGLVAVETAEKQPVRPRNA